MDNTINYSHHSAQFTLTQLIDFWVISNADIWQMLEEKMYLSNQIIWEIICYMDENNLNGLIEMIEKMSFWMYKTGWDVFSQIHSWMHISKEKISEIILQMHQNDFIEALITTLKVHRWISDLPEQIIQFANYKLYWEDVLKHQKLHQTRTQVLLKVEELIME